MDKYVSLLTKLNNINKYRGMKLTLDNIKKACEVVGNPQKHMNFIHVAGTNGKGSVSLKLQKTIQSANYKCGIFTSPHLFTYQERIMINEDYIEKDAVVSLLEDVFNLTEKHKIELTFFEYLNVMALLYFKEKNVDTVVLETGLGGILDSTNVLDKNLAAVITSIGLDHTNVLGYTLDSIARHKAGIIKPNCPVVIGPNAQPLEVFEEVAASQNCPLYITQGNEQSAQDYNLENGLIVKKTIETIKKHNPGTIFDNITQEHIEQGCQYNQKCRLEPLREDLYSQLSSKINKQFHLYFDVGHNPIALEKTFMRMKLLHPTKKINVVYGTSSAKDCLDALQMISRYVNKCHLIQADHYRAMSINDIISSSEQLKLVNSNWKNQVQPLLDNGNVQSNLDNLFNNTLQDQEVVIVVGSFFIMREVREYFGYQDLKDPMELNERVVPIKKENETNN